MNAAINVGRYEDVAEGIKLRHGELIRRYFSGWSMNNSTMLKNWNGGAGDKGLTRITFEQWSEQEQGAAVLCACLAACEQIADYGVSQKDRGEKGILATFRIAITILSLGMSDTLVEASKSATKISYAKFLHTLHRAISLSSMREHTEAMAQLILKTPQYWRDMMLEKLPDIPQVGCSSTSRLPDDAVRSSVFPAGRRLAMLQRPVSGG